MKKRFLSICLVLSMVMPGLGAFALDTDSMLIRSNIMVEEIDSQSDSNAQDAGNTSDGTLSITDNGSAIHLQFGDENEITDFNLVGKLYPFTEGMYAEKKLVGEYEITSRNGSVDVEKVKFDKLEAGTAVSIRLTDNEIDKSYIVTGLIDDNDFSTLYRIGLQNKTQFLQERDNENADTDYKDKIVWLDLGDAAFPDEVGYAQGGPVTYNSGMDFDSLNKEEPQNTSGRANKTTLDDFSYSQINNMIRGIRAGSLSLSGYGISPDFFTETGYQHTYADNFCASKYTHTTGDGIYYTRLSVLTIINGWKPEFQQIHQQMAVESGIMIVYASGSNTATLYQDNYGLKIKNVGMKIDNLRGNVNNIFVYSRISGIVSDDSINIPILIGLVPKAKFFTTVWNAFKTHSTSTFSGATKHFDGTVAEQSSRYSGEVIRGIALDSKDVYMLYQGQHMLLEGGINLVGTAYWDYEWKYTASPN